MMINFGRTNDINNMYVNILVYGNAGAGKTRLAATCEKPLILSAESGLLSLNDYDLPFVNINSINDMREMYKFLAQAPDADQYDTIVVDSLSEIAECCLTHEKTLAKDGRKAYMEMKDQIIKLIRGFRDLPHHLYITSTSERIQDEDSKMLFVPAMPGNKLAQSLPFFFDEIFALRVEKEQQDGVSKEVRFIQTREADLWLGKDRSGKLDEREPPHIGNIIKKIKGISDE